MKKKTRIFVGLVEVAGYFGNLKKGFLENGVECEFITLDNHKFNYGNEDRNIFSELIKKINKINLKNKKIYFRFSYFLSIIPRLMLLIYILFKFDVIIYSLNSTLLSFLELPIYKLFNKKIIYVYLGSDSRPPYLNGRFVNSGNYNSTYKRSIKKKKIIKKVEKYADYIIDYPPQAHFHERNFISGLTVGFPISGFEEQPKKREKINKDYIRILHAPSSPIIKGSFNIDKYIENLKNKGYNIDFIKIVNKEHSEVIQEIKNCDFVIDQMYSDTPLAGLATEAAFFGKASIVGSYYVNYINNDVEKRFIPPSAFCLPEELESKIEYFINNIDQIKEIGRESQKFVKNNWGSKVVARKYMDVINGKIPKSNYFSPYNIEYIYGVGTSKSQLKNFLKNYLHEYGEKGLCLNDKPDLVERIKKFIDTK